MTSPVGRLFRAGWRVFRLEGSCYVWDPAEEFLARVPEEAVDAWDAAAPDGCSLREVFHGNG